MQECLDCGDNAVSNKLSSLDTGQAARRQAIVSIKNRPQSAENHAVKKDTAQGLCHPHKAWVVANPREESFATHALCFSTGV
jgi:hypothetical protein